MNKSMSITIIKIMVMSIVIYNNMVMDQSMDINMIMVMEMVMVMDMGIFNLDNHKIRANGNHILNMYLVKLKFQHYLL
jgi:limonene-1,2-epoxide hydrolase